MKLDLTKFVALQKVIQYSAPKKNEQRYDSSYFDFEASKIYVTSERFNGEIEFSFQTEEDEVVKNFFIDTAKLFLTLQDFDVYDVEMTLKETENSFAPLLKKGRNTYRISSILAEDEDFEVDLPEGNLAKTVLTRKELDAVSEAVLFVDAHNEYKFNSVSISTDGKVFGITPTRLYITQLENTSLDVNLALHRDIVKILNNFNEVEINYSEDSAIILAKGEGFKFIYGYGETHTEIPSEDDISNVISRETAIEVDSKATLELLRFFDPFYQYDSKPIRITVESETELKLSTVSSFDEVEKYMEATSPSELVGTTFKVNGSILKNALSLMEERKINVYASEGVMGILVTDETCGKEVIITKYQD